mgnify:CR=1 FL=1
MLYIFRLIITVIYSILVCVFGSIYCLFSPRNPKHVATFGHMFGRLAPLFGLKVECRKPADAESYGNAIYIANHQNNYDMVTASNIVQPPTVTVGKKSLLWIPFFGQLYWLTGNLLIDRNNRTKAHGTIAEVVNHFKKRRISIWMFPEGTRNRTDAPLLEFHAGSLKIAEKAQCPIVPMTIANAEQIFEAHSPCIRKTKVIIEYGEPIETKNLDRTQQKALTSQVVARISETYEKNMKLLSGENK